MDDQEVYDISSDESDNQEAFDRRALLAPVVTRVVDALGGNETGEYRMGDEVTGCLRDLKKLWRKDETDDERTVARLFWESRVLLNDLIPILLLTAGRGLMEDKRAILCADLMTAMTWPIDMSEELKELDEELDKGTDYTQLLGSHLHYKAALLKPGVIEALFEIILPPLAKGRRERTERDGQIVNVILHLIRNLAFIKDLPPNSYTSADQAEFSSLQSRFIKVLSETHTIQLLLTIAANADNDPLFNSWNTLVLEILYLLFRGAKPTSLATDQAKQPTETLHRLLAQEERLKRDLGRKSSTRHSRFGTTISVKLNPNKKHAPTNEDRGNEADTEQGPQSKSLVLHRQQAINREAGSILDMTKHRKGKKGNTVDELTRDDNLSIEARVILQNLAIDFVEACFNPFLSALLKDIRSERAKITEKDNLRLLFVAKWFLEFFLVMRANEQAKGGKSEKWSFALVAEVIERSWIVWVLKRMRTAVDEKPKLWTELQAGIECLTQLLLLIDKMLQSDTADTTLSEAADIIRQQLIYNGEVLDIAYDSLRAYKEGTQSLVYLDVSVHLAYALLRMLERWGKAKSGEMYVRKRTMKRKKKGKAVGEEDGIPDVEEVEEVDEVVHETMFTFEAFEMRFANSEIAHTLLTYLARYKEFSSSENMRRVVSLLHRQAVRAKAEGLFFQVSTLDLFKTILDDQKSFPREQPYKDLVNLINFILRKFFKALAEDPFLVIEAFFPKNRGNWKQFSSWEPEPKTQPEKKVVENTRFPPDIKVKKGYSWSDQIGIAIAGLVEEGQTELVHWTKEQLTLVIDQRRRIIEETDKKDTVDDELEEEDANTILRQQHPSAGAMEKITDYLIPYLDDEQAETATKNPRLKLLFRLCKFSVLDEDADEFEWYIPRSITPSDLQSMAVVIDQFLENPINLGGKKAAELLSKQRKRTRRRSLSLNSDPENISETRTQRKKDKEKQQYKSAQFIEDSDGEYGDIEAFLEKEKALREKAAVAATSVRPGTMKSAGTKKRRKKGGEGGVKKKRKADGSSAADNTAEESSGEDKESSNSDSDVFGTPPASSTGPSGKSMNESSGIEPPKPAPRPRPRPIQRMLSSQSPPPSERSIESPGGGKNLALPNDSLDDIDPVLRTAGTSRSKRLILSDDED